VRTSDIRCPLPDCQKPAKPIRYGRPSKETMADAKKGKIILGGCVMARHSPSHQCAEGHRFLTAEVNLQRETMYQELLDRRNKRNG